MSGSFYAGAPLNANIAPPGQGGASARSRDDAGIYRDSAGRGDAAGRDGFASQMNRMRHKNDGNPAQRSEGQGAERQGEPSRNGANTPAGKAGAKAGENTAPQKADKAGAASDARQASGRAKDPRAGLDRLAAKLRNGRALDAAAGKAVKKAAPATGQQAGAADKKKNVPGRNIDARPDADNLLSQGAKPGEAAPGAALSSAGAAAGGAMRERATAQKGAGKPDADLQRILSGRPGTAPGAAPGIADEAGGESRELNKFAERARLAGSALESTRATIASKAERIAARQADHSIVRPAVQVQVLKNEVHFNFGGTAAQQIGDAILNDVGRGDVGRGNAAGLARSDPAAVLDGKGQTGSSQPLRVLTLRLEPASLGAVRVTLKLNDGTLDVRVEAVKPHTAELLAKSQSDLRAILRAAGLRTDSMSFSALPERAMGAQAGNSGTLFGQAGEAEQAGTRANLGDSGQNSARQEGSPGGNADDGGAGHGRAGPLGGDDAEQAERAERNTQRGTPGGPDHARQVYF